MKSINQNTSNSVRETYKDVKYFCRNNAVGNWNDLIRETEDAEHKKV